MDIWTLVVCLGISWGGCGAMWHTPMPSKDECFEALKAFRFDENASGETRRSGAAFCQPVKHTAVKQ